MENGQDTQMVSKELKATDIKRGDSKADAGLGIQL